METNELSIEGVPEPQTFQMPMPDPSNQSGGREPEENDCEGKCQIKYHSFILI